MIRVKFNDEKQNRTVNFTRLSDTVVQLTGDNVPLDTSGFVAYRLNGNLLGDYSEYTEIVDVLGDGVKFGSPAE